MTHAYHQTKFRWTENLTCRFIQLRKENGKMFTGRKYSAQAGWDFILRQMREEFPTIMADVHYRVLKKKWSNLLQQYKELKNPVHGDRNKADDVSWPFFTAIDEVLVGNAKRTCDKGDDDDGEPDDEDDNVNPQEFLYVTVSPDESESSLMTMDDIPIDSDLDCKVFKNSREEARHHTPKVPRTTRINRRVPSKNETRRYRECEKNLLSRLPRATELSIRTIQNPLGSRLHQQHHRQHHYQHQATSGNDTSVIAMQNGNSSSPSTAKVRRFRDVAQVETDRDDLLEEERDRDLEEEVEEEEEEVTTVTGRIGSKRIRREDSLERRLIEFFEYTKRRDEENRSIMMRMLQAVETIANKL